MKKIQVDEGQVRIIGRTLKQEGDLYLNYSAAAIEFKFVGKSLQALIKSDYQEDYLKGWAAIIVDDAETPYRRFELLKGEHTYVIFESKTVQSVKIRLVKLSEVAFAPMIIKALIMDEEAEISPTLPLDRKIEFIGDSITCGYGITGVWNEDTFSTATENAWKTYATQVARYFKADYHCVSWSGIGVYSAWTENGVANQDLLMSKLYEYTDWQASQSLEKKERWDFKRFEPDLIVVHLGTNDASYTQNDVSKVNAFGAAYYAFIKHVYEANPNSKILCALGVMGDELYPELEKQVKRYEEEVGGGILQSLHLTLQQEADGIGADWHPSYKTHQKMAKEFIEAIKDFCHWE